MQLVAYGAQDVYLTGSPQVTFFKVIYRRHTNFSVEPIPQTFTGSADFGRTVTCTLNRSGDLIGPMYLNANLKAVDAGASSWGYVRRLGLALLQHYKIEIGGSKIDEQYGDWLNAWYELSHKVGQERGFSRMIGDVPELTTISNSAKPAYQLYVPLQLWFNRNNGLALPLIALQYHDVRLTIDFRPAAQCVNVAYGRSAPDVRINDAQLIIDYVYLDAEERKRFAQASHEYLIEQLQFTGSETLTGVNNKYRLNFNHPCKHLVWVPHLEKYNSGKTFVAYASDNNWDSARDRFAKVMWLASREGARFGEGNVLEIPSAESTGEVTNPPTNSSWDAVVNSLVEAQLIDSAMTNSGSSIPVVSLENVVLLRNNFTMAHLSLTVDELASEFNIPSFVAGDEESLRVLQHYGVNVFDHFNYGNYINRSDNPCVSGKLQLNGADRFQERDGAYFNYVQPWQHFSNTPADGVNVYSFALKPEDHQPSGTCNFSRIDNATLHVKLGLANSVPSSSTSYINDFLGSTNSNSVLNIYAVNYNVLRVMSGMAGAAYSN
jgi:hypothetical protein